MNESIESSSVIMESCCLHDVCVYSGVTIHNRDRPKCRGHAAE